MASDAPITGAPACAPAFTLNGCTLADEPHPYLGQAHAVLCCLEAACRETGEGPLNQDIIAAAADAAQTLIFHAARALHDMDEGPIDREGR